MRTLSVLLFCAIFCYGDQTPKLWGSRLVSTPNGTTPAMWFSAEPSFDVYVIVNGTEKKMSIKDNSCKINNTVFSKPCSNATTTGKGLNITLSNITQSNQNKLLVVSKSPTLYVFSTAYFVPKCNFTDPKKNEVDLKTSFPFSRFVNGSKNVTINFAVQGTNSTVNLLHNGQRVCMWQGTKCILKNYDFCKDMERDNITDLRTFRGNFPKMNSSYDSYFWTSNGESYLTVSVDWTQKGISPEVEDCQRLFTV
ncbi:hypothetical protein Aperf_G00000108201 [Anoplocephala perfoliata]